MLKHVSYEGELPVRCEKRNYNSLVIFLKEFLDSGRKIEIVHYSSGDYTSAKSVYQALRRAAIQEGFPIDVATRRGSVFIINRSI